MVGQRDWLLVRRLRPLAVRGTRGGGGAVASCKCGRECGSFGHKSCGRREIGGIYPKLLAAAAERASERALARTVSIYANSSWFSRRRTQVAGRPTGASSRRVGCSGSKQVENNGRILIAALAGTTGQTRPATHSLAWAAAVECRRVALKSASADGAGRRGCPGGRHSASYGGASMARPMASAGARLPAATGFSSRLRWRPSGARQRTLTHSARCPPAARLPVSKLEKRKVIGTNQMTPSRAASRDGRQSCALTGEALVSDIMAFRNR